METRHAEIELRSTDKSFSGYIARFYDQADPGTEYELLPGLFERIHPDAFKNITRDVTALYNHDPSMPLGKVGSDTLKLRSDGTGLKATLKYNGKDPDHRKLKSKIDSKTALGASFGFLVRKDQFTQEDGRHIRWLLDVDLIEVSMGVTFPAYSAPNIKIRAEGSDLEDIAQRYHLWQETQKRLDRLDRY